MKTAYKTSSASSVSLIAAMTALTAALPMTAHSELVLEEIIVSAQKRAENLQDVPIAVSSITGDALEAAGVVDTGALASVTSGVAIQQTGQSFQPYIRGVGTPAFGPGVENPVALYVDDVYYVSQIQGIINLVDVSQLNILKGPQGTLFGRNATGGVIQLTTRDPQAEFGGSFRTELDNYLTSRSNLYMTGGIASNINANVSLSYATQGEGWGKNINTGNDISKLDHDMGLRSKWLFELSDETRLKLALDYTDREGSIGSNRRAVPGAPNFLTAPFEYPADPWDVNTPFESSNSLKGGGASLRFETNLGFADLVSISAYRSYSFHIKLDSSYNPIPLLDIGYQQLGRQLSEEIQLISPKGDRFSWVTGLYYLKGRETGRDVDVTIHPGFQPNTILSRTNVDLYAESAAIFGQGTLHLPGDANLTLGARYTNETRKIKGGDVTILNDFLVFPGDPRDYSIFPKDKIDVSKMTYRLSFDKKLNDDLMTYLSYNRGFKSGGFNAFRTDAGSYRPEIIDAYEAGLKSELLDHRLRLNSAIFYNKYKDIQVQKFQGTSAVTVNGARAEFYGLDLDAEMKVSDNLSFTSGFEWLHAVFKDYPDADFYSPIPSPTGGIGVASGSAEGKRVPYAPKWTANIGINYTRDTSLGKLGLNLSEAHNDGYFNDSGNDAFLRQKSFDQLNAGISLGVLDETLTVELWGRNLLNEVVSSVQFAVVPIGYGQDNSNPPRTVGLTATYRFGH